MASLLDWGVPWRHGTYRPAGDAGSMFSEGREGRGRMKTLPCKGFSVQQVPAIEPARPARRVVPGVTAWYRRGTYGPTRDT